MFLVGAGGRVAVQNLYHRVTIEAVAMGPGMALTERLAWIGNERYYPPLHPWIVLAFAHLTGNDAAMVTRLLWAVPIGTSLLIATFYRLRRRAALGWAAAGVYLLLPGVWEAAVFPFMDVTPTVFLAAAFCLLEAGRTARGRGADVATGIVLGLGMMTKWTFGLFAGPWAMLAASWRFSQGGDGTGKATPARLATVAAGFLPVALPWYVFRLQWSSFFQTAGNNPDPRAWGMNAHVLREFSKSLWGAPSTTAIGLVLALFIVHLATRRNRRGAAFVAAALLVPLLGFLRLPHMEARYLAPLWVSLLLVPAFASGRVARTASLIFLIAIAGGATAGGVVPEFRALRAVRSDPRHAATPWYNPVAADALAWFASLAAGDPSLHRVVAHPIYRSELVSPEETLGLLVHQAARVRVDPYGLVYYPIFVDILRRGSIRSHLLTTCRDAADCATRQRKFYDVAARDSPPDAPFVSPGGDLALPAVATEAFGADWPLIERDFTLQASARIGPETWYLWKPNERPLTTRPNRRPDW
jgi:hypothetical protein